MSVSAPWRRCLGVTVQGERGRLGKYEGPVSGRGCLEVSVQYRGEPVESQFMGEIDMTTLL